MKRFKEIIKESEEDILEESIVGILNKIKDYLFGSGMEYKKVDSKFKDIISKKQAFANRLDAKDQVQLDRLIKSDKSILARIQKKLEEEKNKEKVQQAKQLIDNAIDNLK